jgi:valyl-tRNA synthetase
LIGEMRSLRAEMNIDPKKALDAKMVVKNPSDTNLIRENLQKILSLARLNSVEFSDSISGNLLRGVARLGEFGLDVRDAINIQSERERLQKEMIRVQGEIDKILKKINSHEFVERAPHDIVLEIRARHDELCERYQKLEANLKYLPQQ